MRRAIAALALAALALAIFASGRPTEDAHAATSCAKHTKRVVKHVKRHGKRKKVVRLRPYWTCHEIAEPVAAIPVVPVPTPTPETPAPQPEPEANAIGVVARDANKHFSFEPTRTLVKAGKLTMQLINEGEDPHTMAIQRIGPGETPEGEVVEIPATASKQQSTGTAEVQPGRYRMWCTLFHHAEEGMEFDLTVE
jgi:plastocyanin